MSGPGPLARAAEWAGGITVVAGAIKMIWSGARNFFTLINSFAGTEEYPGVLAQLSELRTQVDNANRGNLHIIDQQNAATEVAAKMRADLDRALYQLYPDSGNSIHDRVVRVEASLENIRLQVSQRRPR